VLGISTPPNLKGGDGVQGITNSEARNGVFGVNESTAPRNTSDPGGNGVFGYSSVPDAAGVMGVNGTGGIGVSGASAGSHGVMGSGDFGVTGRGNKIGIWGIADGNGWAGQFTGPVIVSGTAFFQNPGGECVHAETQSGSVAAIAAFQQNQASDSAALYAKHEGGRTAAFFEGNVVVTGDIVLTNAADCAEDFDVAEGKLAEPGTVMVLNADGRIEPCSRACDKRVVGVVSGGERFKPGIVLDRSSQSQARRPIALMGKVQCKVDTRYGPVDVGDMLTTSPTPGHAMRVQDGVMAFGAVIGKAMQPMAEGCGSVAVLVALQ
jgi:hypothetical protein